MCWTDRIATSNIIKLQKEFDIRTCVSTGTFRGADAELYSHYFKEVLSMDIDEKNIEIAKSRLKHRKNVELHLMHSAEFIKDFRWAYETVHDSDIIYFYLDAHFYDPKALPDKRWVVVDELKALKGFKDCVIVIHDFDCSGLGHLVYDGEHMGWNVIGKHIQKVNPDFHYYCNTKELCDIVTNETVKEVPITTDEYIQDALKFVHSSDTKKYRGILYATPEPLDLTEYELKEYEYAI